MTISKHCWHGILILCWFKAKIGIFFQKNNQNWHLSIIMHYIGNNSKIGVSAMENNLRGVYICFRYLNKVSFELAITYLTFPSETKWQYWTFMNICEHMWFEVSAQPPFLGVISRLLISWLDANKTTTKIEIRQPSLFYITLFAIQMWQNNFYITGYELIRRFSHLLIFFLGTNIFFLQNC